MSSGGKPGKQLIPTVLVYILICLILCSGCVKEGFAPCGFEETPASETKLYKVLFIGNSLTFTHNIPDLVSSLASSKGDSAYTLMAAPGGFTLEDHYKLGSTKRKIETELWDFVVIQGSAYRSALPASQADSLFFPFADSLFQMIKNNHSSTEILLNMPTAYENGASACEEDPLLCDYSGMQDQVRKNYIHLSERLESPIAPVGILWKILMDKDPSMEIFSDDGVHATPEGAYLSACTLYSMLFLRSPVSAFGPPQISGSEIESIQNTVYQTLFRCNPDWSKF